MAAQERDAVVSTGGWILFYLIMCIPLVNLIYILVTAFSSGANRNKQNLCRAMLLLFLLAAILGGTAAVLGGAASMLGNLPGGNLIQQQTTAGE